VRLGRYELIEPLGMGGMAEVFKARTFGPGGFERHVVIKRIQRAHWADPDFLRMFIEEAKILGVLHHPNVVQVYEFGEDRGTLFLAMEYVEGPSLSRVLRTLADNRRRLPPGIVAYVGREVCRALDYVHNLSGADGRPLGIIHRDVTPSNIMLCAGGGIKLLDFGVAKSDRSEPLTRAGTVKGKPAYLAPEQLDQRKVDGRVDLFALGVVLHEMLSLEHLFAGDRDLVTLKNVREMTIPRPSAGRPDVPPDLDAVIMRALERDPDRRYAGAGEMARALDEVVLASQLRMDDVTTLVHNVQNATPSPPSLGHAGPRAPSRAPSRCDTDRTVRDVGMRLTIPLQHFWNGTRLRNAATVAGFALAVALATAVGLRVMGPPPFHLHDPSHLTRTANAELAPP
jgi:serine/threonine-protein kinase